MTKFDLVALGDNATDAFIKLSEAELHCEINRPECRICMRFASKIPYEGVTEIPAGGNSSNVAIASAKLGLKTALISGLGQDLNGDKALRKLTNLGVNIDFIKIFPQQQTNYNYVLWYQDDRTILVKHEDYPSLWPDNFPTTSWIYLSSISDSDFSLHQKLSAWLEDNPETKLAFSPGTWQIKLGREKLKEIYARTEIFFSNKQEAEKVVGEEFRGLTSDSPEIGLRKLAEAVKALGPKIVVITDGEQGAFCLDEKDKAYFQTPLDQKAKERTGAGDSFASAFLSATIKGKTSQEALLWGTINAASVVSQIGPHAGLLAATEIETKIESENLTAKRV